MAAGTSTEAMMTEHPPLAALPVPRNAAFQEHSGAGSEQVHAVFGSGVQCFGPVIYQALCTSMLGKELSTGVVNMGLGERPDLNLLRASRAHARARRLRPVHNR